MIMQELRETCRQLLAEGTVQVVIGYGQDPCGRRVTASVPVFDQRRPEDVDQLRSWNDQCCRPTRLDEHTLQPDARKSGSPWASRPSCVKGCDERALVVLEKESQIDRSQIDVIGMACDGVGAAAEMRGLRRPHAARADVVIGQAAAQATPVCGRSTLCGDRSLPGKTPAERMAYWTAGAGPLREVLCLPAGLPDVLLPAVHRR